MNYVNQQASIEDACMSRMGSMRRFFTTVKRFFFSPEEVPIQVGSAFVPITRSPTWAVTVELTQQTAFGSVSTQSMCWVQAESEPNAICTAKAKLKESHPDFIIASLKAQRTSGR